MVGRGREQCGKAVSASLGPSTETQRPQFTAQVGNFTGKCEGKKLVDGDTRRAWPANQRKEKAGQTGRPDEPIGNRCGLRWLKRPVTSRLGKLLERVAGFAIETAAECQKHQRKPNVMASNMHEVG